MVEETASDLPLKKALFLFSPNPSQGGLKLRHRRRKQSSGLLKSPGHTKPYLTLCGGRTTTSPARSRKSLHLADLRKSPVKVSRGQTWTWRKLRKSSKTFLATRWWMCADVDMLTS